MQRADNASVRGDDEGGLSNPSPEYPGLKPRDLRLSEIWAV
jgi:hypothetical protein